MLRHRGNKENTRPANRTFNNLLKEATDEIRLKQDEKFAVSLLLEEVASSARDLLQQEEGKKIAKKISSEEPNLEKNGLPINDRFLAAGEQDSKVTSLQFIRDTSLRHSELRSDDNRDLDCETNNDFEVAKALHEKLQLETAAQIAHDEILSMTLQRNIFREEHRSKKRSEYLQLVNSLNLTTDTSVCRQWEEADAEIENVAGGICITILLPAVKDVAICVTQRNSIEVKASRDANSLTRVEASYSQLSLLYDVEFVIEGCKTHILSEHISYEYASDIGLLHVYTEGVCLETVEEVVAPEKAVATQPRRPRKGILTNLRQRVGKIFARKSQSTNY